MLTKAVGKPSRRLRLRSAARTLSLTAAGVMLTLGLGEATGLAHSFTGQASRASRIVLATQGCTHGIRRPTSIVFTCADAGLRASGLRWRSWGGQVAVGSGVLHEKLCVPSCAEGGSRSRPMTIHLYRRRKCPGRRHLYYRSATFVFADGSRSKASAPCPF